MRMVALSYVLPSCAIAMVAENKLQKWILLVVRGEVDRLARIHILLKVMTR